MKKKMVAIQVPKRSSLKPVLIYSGNLYPTHRNEIEEYFYKLIHVSELFDFDGKR